MKNKVLVIHASAGGGHKRAAEAMAKEFALAGDQWDCTVLDALDFTPRAFQWYYRDLYHLMLKKTPWMWANLFALTDSPYMTPKRRLPGLRTNAWIAHKLVQHAISESPDAIICTHFLPLEVLWLAKQKGRITTPLYCTITDFYAHGLWLLPGIDRYYVGNQAVARHIDRWSNLTASAQVTGIPIAADFSLAKRTPQLIDQLGLQKNLPTALLLAGALGMSPILDAYKSICALNVKCQVVIVAGNDKQLEMQLRQLAANSPVHTVVFGYVTNIHELMACSDIAITKPGGLTTAECLAMGLVMLMVDPIPGQEDRNMEYVLENGAGRRLYHPADAGHIIQELVCNRDLLQQMRDNSARLGHLESSAEIVKTTLSSLIAHRCNVN